MVRTTPAARGLKTELDGVAASGRAVSDVFKGALGAHLVAGAFTRAASAAQDFLRGSVDAVLQGQRIGRSLQFAAGGAAAGAEEFAFVKAESERLGLQLNTTAASYAKLTAASKGTELQGRGTREIFVGVAEATTVLGLSSEESAGALNAIQQMMSKGTVQAEELRGQLGERIPGAFQMAARVMGVTTAELGKMLEQGQVISAEFLPKFARELHNTFGRDAVSAAQQGQAGINRFKTALFELSGSFGSGFMVGVTATLNRLRETFQDAGFRESVKALGENLGRALAGLVEHFGALVTAGKAFFAMFAVGKLAAIVTGIRSMGIALAAVVASNPILAALTVTIGAATIAWDQAKKSSKTWHDELKEGEDLLKRYNPQIDTLESRLKKLGEAAMKNDPFANIAPDAGNKSNQAKLSEDQAKTLAKLQKEAAQARIEATEEGFNRERALEILNHQGRLAEIGSFDKAVVLEKQRHADVLAGIATKEAQETASSVEKANQNARERRQKELQAEKAILERHRQEIEDEKKNRDTILEGLAADEFAKQRAQQDAHFREMGEAIEKYAYGRAEKERMLTELHKRQSEARRRTDREEAAARMGTAAAMVGNLLQAGAALFAQNKKNAVLLKTLAIGEIAINTAVAVMKTLAQGGFWAMPLALSIGALGAAQAVKVSQQKFARGGIVEGPYTSGDRIQVAANAGEMILTRGQQAQLYSMLAGGWGAGQRSGGGNTYEINYRPTYQISGSVSSPAVRDLIAAIDRDRPAFGTYLKTEIFAKGYA